MARHSADVNEAPMPETSVAVPGAATPGKSHGEVHVVSRVVGFKKIKFYTNENIGSGELDLPEQQMHTTSYWMTIPSATMQAMPFGGDDRRDGVVGLAFAMKNIAQLLLMCDGHDIGLSVDGGSLDRSTRTGRYRHRAGGAGRRAERVHLRQLSGWYRLQPSAVRDARPAAGADAGPDHRLPLLIGLPVVCRPGRQHRAARQAGGLTDPDAPAARVKPRGVRSRWTSLPGCARSSTVARRSRCGSSPTSPTTAIVRVRRSISIVSPMRWADDGSRRGLVSAWSSTAGMKPSAGTATSGSASASSTTWTRCRCWTRGLAGIGVRRDKTVFIDLETTGLSGGAGTLAFLVGCGYFDLGAFQVRQFLLTSHAGERALLAAVAEFFNDTDLIVTYNGKTFDVPVMETRWTFHRMDMPLDGVPHFDMLHPARRLWKGRPDAAHQCGRRRGLPAVDARASAVRRSAGR